MAPAVLTEKQSKKEGKQPGDAPQNRAMGAVVLSNGVSFRVWAPHAEFVSVVGDFNKWDNQAHPLAQEEGGLWHAEVPSAKLGDEYRFFLKNGEQEFLRIDPYARQVTNSIGNGVICNGHFDWGDDHYEMPSWNELVIYEMHVGTFGGQEELPATFKDASRKLDHLAKLGVNAIEIMPAAEFAGDLSWGYNPAHIFAIESAYGGPNALKQFVKEAHRRGIAVIMDVVYNHFGPSDLDLWQFDGWSENGGGGIYFYNDWKANTPWGATRPDYGRTEVRQFIMDNAMMWIDEYHVDGLRMDMTLFIRNVHGDNNPSNDLPDGWSLTQWVNREVRLKKKNFITIAEDLQNNEYLTKDDGAGGAHFGSQWDAKFVHPIRAALITPNDAERSMASVRDSLYHKYNGDAFQRVVYSESHDEVANGKARVTSEINTENPQDWFARKRATLGTALVLTSPGIPMLFQGQEFLEDGWFQDGVPLDWEKAKDFKGIVKLHRDLIALRRNLHGNSRGLSGQHVFAQHVNDDLKLIAFRRWNEGGAGDDVIVVANFSHEERKGYRIGFPAPGKWHVRLNSDSPIYSDMFDEVGVPGVETEKQPQDGWDDSALIDIGGYSVLILSQDK